MSKVKVHELAKELGLSSNELIKKANDLGINVTSHMNVISNEQIEVLKKHMLDTQNNKGEGKKNKMQKKAKNEAREAELKRQLEQIEQARAEREARKVMEAIVAEIQKSFRTM